MEQVKRVAMFLAATERCRQRYLPVAARGLAWAAAFSTVEAAVALRLASTGVEAAAVVAAAFLAYEAVYRLLVRGVSTRRAGRRFYAGAAAAAAAAVAAAAAAGGEWMGTVMLAGAVAALSLEVASAYPLATVASYASAALGAWAYLGLGSLEAGLALLSLSALAAAAAAVRRLVTCSDEALETLKTLEEG